MKNSLTKLLLAGFMLFGTVAVYAQLPSIQYYRYNDMRGLNVFETSKTDSVIYQGLKLRVGGDFAMQFQGISQTNDADPAGGPVADLEKLDRNMTLPTSNLNFDLQMEDGLRLHMRIYLSSRHHAEAWVKGGHIQMDNLNFISEGFLSGVMDVMNIRVGMDEINYGDTHFRRTDNARAIYNPFVGNYIMDSFTTEPFIEFTYQNNGIIGVLGASNGRLNQEPASGDDGRVIYGKVGYDKQMNDDLRFRLTGSFYKSSSAGTRDYLYSGDRAGARYYNVLHTVADGGSDFEPRFSPGFARDRAAGTGYLTAIMINPFVKFKGIEFFGVWEKTSNGNGDVGGAYTQLGTELIYRFGSNEQFYAGGRYNKVSGEDSDVAGTKEISRTNLGFGWFMTKNMLLKTEYVKQTYDGDGYAGSKYQGATFNGVVLEAAISF